jgi:hypothetical protein
MKNSINLPEVQSISTDDCLENIIIVTDVQEHEIAIEEGLIILENLNIINDYNLNEEEVAVDMYYCDENSHRNEEVEKTEWFNMFDFINDLSLEQGQQILSEYIKQEEATAAAEVLEQKKDILKAFGVSIENYFDETKINLQKNSEGDIHFQFNIVSGVVGLYPDSSKVVIHELSYGNGFIFISGTFVA